MRGGIWASVFVCAGTALWSACTAEAATKAKPQISAETLKRAIEGKTVHGWPRPQLDRRYSLDFDHEIWTI